MCGINGFTFENKILIKEMNNYLTHRGPDSSGIYLNHSLSLGHTRLKIIDLSEKAAQPMSDSNQDIWIVFNGEIYNFKEVREKLKKEGYQFKSNSDTEVIINAYKKWGYDCIQYLNGMWAFAIYDKEKNKLFLSRDRLGKKPLYYIQDNNNLIFSSEIKPLFIHDIKKELNKQAISSFLSYRYVLGKETMFENIFKLLPAHNLIFNIKNKKIEKIWEYWDVDKKDLELKESLAKDKTKELLKNSILIRQVSDVPIGSINSGGLDSSLISAIMAKINKNPIKTFTVKFPEKGFDETSFAKILTDHCNTDHKEVTINPNNFFSLMKEYSQKKDEPIGVPNEIALYLLFKKIKQDVTVILSGEGADEIFAGYSRIFRSPYDYERLSNLKKLNIWDYKQKYPSLYKKYKGKLFNSRLEHFMFLYNYFPEEEKNFILKNDFKKEFAPIFKEAFDKINGSYEKKISYVFLKLHLPGLLARLDNSSMASAVEARCPFIDYKLISFVFNLPFNLKNPWKSKEDKLSAENKNCDEIAENNDIPKYLLKEIAKNYIPEEIINRKKQGFPLPLQKWFKEDFFEEVKKILFAEDSKIRDIFEMDKFKKWIKNSLNNKDKEFGQKLWRILSLELWLREWF